MTVSIQVQTRRLGRSGGSIRVATEQDSGGARACHPGRTPRTPHDGKPPRMGSSQKAEGGSIAKFFAGVSDTLKISGEIVVTYVLSPVAVRTPLPRNGSKFPRNTSILPRFVLFIPRRVFSEFHAISISLSIFQRREKRKSAKNGKTSFPRNFEVWCKNNPGIFQLPPEFRGLFFKQNPMLARVCGRLTPFPPIPGLKCLYPPGRGSQ